MMVTQVQETADEQLAHEIGIEAYIYLYPLVTMDVTRRQLINTAPGKAAIGGPMNTFTHVRAYPSADFRVVVRPNFDTLYSVAWLDITNEPVVVSVPDRGSAGQRVEALPTGNVRREAVMHCPSPLPWAMSATSA